jgi:very-short-patch-repair endonuclease
VGSYFVDFLCRERMVVVEIDGGTHSTASEIASDERRAADLRRLGYRVYRVHNIDVYDNLDRVLDALLAFAQGESR